MKEKNIKQLITDNIVIVVLILLVVGFSIGNPTFLKTANVINLFGQMCLNAILATGLTYVIILGGIDISVGSSMAITGILAAQVVLAMNMQATPVIMLIQILVGLVGGALIGLFIGWLVAYRGFGSHDLYIGFDAGIQRFGLYHFRRWRFMVFERFLCTVQDV
ncbi:MAG: ABC transporter permease [Clostridia bacterium]